MAAGSRPRRVMILFRPVLRIYAIGDSDKPRRREKERKENEDEVAASERYVLYLASVRGRTRREDVSQREKGRKRDI